MKAILLSIKPEWVCKILNGEKTIEIRKTAPKCDLPIEVYIYCTEKNGNLWMSKTNRSLLLTKVGGAPYTFIPLYDAYDKLNSKIVAKFTLDEIYEYQIEDKNTWKDKDFGETTQKLMGMGLDELHAYVGDKTFYGWHVSDLVIFDEPKEISEFKYWKKYHGCGKCPYAEDKNDFAMCENGCKELLTFKRAPQSWCYLEERK